MQRPRIRLEIRGIMAAVAVSALVVGVYRADVAPSVAVVLIVGSTSALAYKRYADGLAQRVNEARLTTRSQKTTLFMSSVIVAVTIIGLSDATFLVGYYALGEVLLPLSFGHHTSAWIGRSREPELQELLIGITCGFVMAMIVAAGLRSTIWPIVTEPLPPAPPPEERRSSQ
jgi:hypothetical protein